MDQGFTRCVLFGMLLGWAMSVACPPKKRHDAAGEIGAPHGGAGSDMSLGSHASDGECSSSGSGSCSPLSMSWSRPSSGAGSFACALSKAQYDAVFEELDGITAALRDGIDEECKPLEGYKFVVNKVTCVFNGRVEAIAPEWERKDIFSVVSDWWLFDLRITRNEQVDVASFVNAVTRWVSVLQPLKEDMYCGLKERVTRTVFKFASGYIVHRKKRWLCRGCIYNIRRIFESIKGIATSESRARLINEVLDGLQRVESIVVSV